MLSFKKSLLLVAATLSGLWSGAQNMSDLIISEVMAEPDSTSLVDSFGERNGWVEIFNTSQGTVNFGGCFLSDDRNDLKKSPVSNLDRATRIGPRQSLLMYSSGIPENGTFHMTFKIRRGTTIYLTSNDGRTIIDSLTIPSTIPTGKSIAKFANDNKAMVFNDIKIVVPSPGTYNAGGAIEMGAVKMAREDPHGFILTVVSVAVVFTALLILWWLFSLLFQGKKKEKAPKAKVKKAPAGALNPEVALAIAMALSNDTDDETAAAIGLAMHQWFADTVHDTESFVLTIKRPATSAWNDKSDNFRQLPN